MAKFDFKKLADAKWIGIAMAGFAAIGAFMTSIEDQKKDKLIKDLADRVAKLENK
jgi:hypothetical protein